MLIDEPVKDCWRILDAMLGLGWGAWPAKVSKG
jgi:hypothetical protein